MSWVRIDDGLPENEKVLALGDDYERGLALHVRGLCYCARALTDGRVPARMFREDRELVARLVAVGLWHEVGDHYEINDYLQYNPSRESVEKRREEWRKRQAKSRDVSRRDTDNDTHRESTSPHSPFPIPHSPVEEPPTPQTPQGAEGWTLRMNPSQITKLAKTFGDEQVRTAAIKLEDDERQGLVTIKTSFHALLKHRLENPPAPEQRRMTPDGVPLDEL
ncbi:MAG: hypothetical protein AAGU73_05855 [Actinomycetota bacterium]